MKVYLVGGAVRDEILGRPCHDRDYVVVGSTAEEMIQKGFVQVGASFPVFLHPETGEEYALARTERKNGKGHKGFDTFYDKNVTIEQDLVRRDLTINSIAKDLQTGEYIDPCGGIADIHAKVLRHTSEAFKDDPLRVLRLFRFQAQLGGRWKVATETMTMAYSMRHELKDLPAERKWKEMEKALNTAQFSGYAFFMYLLGELPELAQLIGVEQPPEHHPEGDAFKHTMMCLREADRQVIPEVKFAVLCHDFGKFVSFRDYGNLYGHEAAGVPLVHALCDRMKVPNTYRDLAVKVTEFHTKIHSVFGRGSNKGMKPKSVMKLFEQLGVVSKNKEAFLDDVLSACCCDARGREGRESDPYPQEKQLKKLWNAMIEVNSKDVTYPLLEKGLSGKQLGEAVRTARINAIRNAMRESPRKEN